MTFLEFYNMVKQTYIWPLYVFFGDLSWYGNFNAGFRNWKSSWTSLFSTHHKEKPAETVTRIINLSNIASSFFESAWVASGLVTKESSGPIVVILLELVDEPPK